MTQLTEIRKALATQIKTNVSNDTNVAWYALADNSTLGRPRISIRPDETYVDYRPHQGTGTNVRLIVRIEPLAKDEENFALRIDEYLDPSGSSSVVAAIDSDQTLGGLVSAILQMTATVDLGLWAEVALEVMVDE